MSTPDLVLGIDAGGTKTSAAVMDAAGNELGRGYGGPCNIATGSEDALRQALHLAVNEAFDRAGLPFTPSVRGVCAGVAGYTARHRRADFEVILRSVIASDLQVVTADYVIAHWGAAGGCPGVTIVAGTGAVAFGINSLGVGCRVDGRGWLLGDRGSAFSVGRAALQAIVRRMDDGLAFTALDRRLLAAMGVEDENDLIEWVYRDFQPARIAALAAEVVACEEDSDAAEMVLGAARCLAETTWKCYMRLNFRNAEPVYFAGGLLASSIRMQQAFQRALKEQASGAGLPMPPVLPARGDPAHGAALLALSSLRRL